MKNVNTYETIKLNLVEQILEKYQKYKNLLEKFYQEIKSGHDIYVLSNPTTPISKQSSANRYAAFTTKKYTDNEMFKWKMENIKIRFEYVSGYVKSLEKVKDTRNELLVSVKDLSVLNNLTSNKKTGVSIGHEIFYPIGKYKINKNLEIHFRGMEQLKWQIESYLLSDYDSEIRESWILSRQNGSYIINDEKIAEGERKFFDETLKAIRHDLEQLEIIESRIESQNFLKYYLLFK
ncbi:TPA: hypothetical protein ACF9CH_002859 [Staphylococcus aureus]|nr:hypothetical protein [Staphylococcus aureus]